MMFAFITTLLSVLVSAETSVCSSSDAIVQDLQVTTDPIEPVIGQNYKLSLSFTTPVEIVEGSTQQIKVSFDGFPIENDKVSLCTELSKNGYDCPISVGQHDMSWDAIIPSDTPSGNLKGMQTWYTNTGEQLFCFRFQFNL